jgi:hypothetical protein
MTSHVEAAIMDYTADGLALLPVGFRPPDRKFPLTPNGHNDATTDQRTILRWLTRWPEAGIGGCTGRGLVVIDVDPRHNGDEGIADATGRLGRLPRTRTATTASGGWHHWFSIPAGVEIRNSAGRLAPGVDVRGSGGWAIMPPSRAPWGSWTWSDRSEMAELPDSWLTALQEQSTPRAKSSEEWAALTASLPDGQRNVDLTSLAGHLLPGQRQSGGGAGPARLQRPQRQAAAAGERRPHDRQVDRRKRDAAPPRSLARTRGRARGFRRNRRSALVCLFLVNR